LLSFEDRTPGSSNVSSHDDNNSDNGFIDHLRSLENRNSGSSNVSSFDDNNNNDEIVTSETSSATAVPSENIQVQDLSVQAIIAQVAASQLEMQNVVGTRLAQVERCECDIASLRSTTLQQINSLQSELAQSGRTLQIVSAALDRIERQRRLNND